MTELFASQAKSDRRNRFFPLSHMEPTRSASQPPCCDGTNFFSSSLAADSSSFTHLTSSPSQSIRFPSVPRSSSIGIPAVARSSSFSFDRSYRHNTLSSVMRESRSFASTFEDDESEILSDIQDFSDEPYLPAGRARGRAYLTSTNRSRSHSLAPGPTPIGGSFQSRTPDVPMGWVRSLDSLNITNPGGVQEAFYPHNCYGLHRVTSRSPADVQSSTPISNLTSDKYHSHNEILNTSPPLDDVRQILLDNGPILPEVWCNNVPSTHADDSLPNSGTTSRRHSVSIVQPRRIIAFHDQSFTAIGRDHQHAKTSHASGSGLMLSDDDLSAGLSSHQLHGSYLPYRPAAFPSSQPSSLPSYARRSSNDIMSDLPVSTDQPSALLTRRAARSVTEHAGDNTCYTNEFVFDAEKLHGSPSFGSHSWLNDPKTNCVDSHQPCNSCMGNADLSSVKDMLQTRQRPSSPTHDLPPDDFSPKSFPPLHSYIHCRDRVMHHGTSTPYAPSQTAPINLRTVPSVCPLYIVEFKAGRNDIFYCPDTNTTFCVGDMVIVEADRGKDLGKVINNTINLAEVQAFQRNRRNLLASDEYVGDTSMSSGSGHGYRQTDVSPKMIYTKAQRQDAESVLFDLLQRHVLQLRIV